MTQQWDTSGPPSGQVRTRRRGFTVIALVAGIGGFLLAGWAARPWWEPLSSWLGQWWPIPVAVVLLATAGVALHLRDRRVAGGDEPDPAQEMRSLSARSIGVGAVVVLGVGVTAAVVLINAFGGGSASDRLDAIRTAATIVVGTGGAAALLLAARRQRATELTLAHQRQVAAVSEHDATERRITELFTKAVEQLGSDKAAVRHGGLYALERLAQNNLGQRQTVVNVLCAYLRAPYTEPRTGTVSHRLGVRRPLLRSTARSPATTTKPDIDVPESDAGVRQEREVRLAAQRILADHLQPDRIAGDGTTMFWPDIDLNLTGATLLDLDFTNCRIRTAGFDGATFTGNAGFTKATFTGNAGFSEATFTGNAGFSEATFTGNAEFTKATFTRNAGFHEATFTEGAWFSEATFTEGAWFNGATFTRNARFDGATFTRNAEFHGATFTRNAEFHGATFTRNAEFKEARAQINGSVGELIHRWPLGWEVEESADTDVSLPSEVRWTRLVPIPVVLSGTSSTTQAG